ncbi:MAG TPA: hypothetical protein VMA34_04695 [Terracidiphilus sp.]|nr:hypothetical protein [Terracidiphilus sp.]
MNRYILIRRLMGPSILVLLGLIALLNQAHLVSWDLFVPLLLILIGVLKLAERAALAAEGYPPAPYPAAPYAGAPYAGGVNPSTAGGPPYPQPTSPAPTSTAIVPSSPFDLDKNSGGGQS